MRLTASSTGIVAGGPSSGRGAWLCRGDVGGEAVDTDDNGDSSGPRPVSGACLDAALARRGFGRAWGRELRPDEIDTLRRLATNDDSHGTH